MVYCFNVDAAYRHSLYTSSTSFGIAMYFSNDISCSIRLRCKELWQTM